eukprot:7146095-Pyramimonas_sp.AAC.1
MSWLKNKARNNNEEPPTAAQWWLLIWTPDVDQRVRPFRCSALASFDGTHADAAQPSHAEGWDQWEEHKAMI